MYIPQSVKLAVASLYNYPEYSKSKITLFSFFLHSCVTFIPPSITSATFATQIQARWNIWMVSFLCNRVHRKGRRFSYCPVEKKDALNAQNRFDRNTVAPSIAVGTPLAHLRMAIPTPRRHRPWRGRPTTLKGHTFGVRRCTQCPFTIRRFFKPTAIERGRFHRPVAHGTRILEKANAKYWSLLPSRGCVEMGTSSFLLQSPNFLKPRFCYVPKKLYLCTKI